VAALALGALAGCSRYEAICAEAKECAGGSDEDEAACVAELETYEELAEIKGCSEEWDALIACGADDNRCDAPDRQLVPGSSCGSEVEDIIKCW
jgi:hypothetical protein